jgi:hypothetical protein
VTEHTQAPTTVAFGSDLFLAVGIKQGDTHTSTQRSRPDEADDDQFAREVLNALFDTTDLTGDDVEDLVGEVYYAERVPTARESAVQMWEDTLRELPSTEWAQTLRECDIHNNNQRREIERVMSGLLTTSIPMGENVNDELILNLEDAWDEIKTEFSF